MQHLNTYFQIPRKLKLAMLMLCLPVIVGLGVAAIAPSQTASAAPSGSSRVCESNTFFGLVPWYKYLKPEFNARDVRVNDGDPCTLDCFNILPVPAGNACGVKHSDIPFVLLAVVDNLLRIAGIAAVIFVIVGAVKYVSSQGNPESVAGAQRTIVNALVGLVVALVAIAFVSFVGGRVQ